MALTDFAARSVVNRMPKVIQPGQHAVIDYVVAGAFVAMGAFFWKRNKRASLAALACGAATAANAMITDYPGGLTDAISFEKHGEIDVALAGLTATLPNFLAFSDEYEAGYFRAMALAETVVAGLTDFEGPAGGKIVKINRA